MSYNGYSNQATYTVQLWIANEYPGVQPGTTAAQFEAMVDELVEWQMDTGNLDGMLLDLLMISISQVNWNELEEVNREDS